MAQGDVVHLREGEGLTRPLLKQELDSVTIIGMGPTACLAGSPMMRGLIPVDERNPVWAINYAAKAMQHTHAWNTHDLTKLREREPHEFIDFYKRHDRPLVTLVPVPGLAASIYPLKEVAEFHQDTYFFAAPSYMIAYALWCGVKIIRLFGLDFDYPNRTDYEAGRACTEYWIGRARSLQVGFQIPNESSLLDLAWQEEGGRMRGYGWPFYGLFDYQPKITYTPEGRMIVEHDPVGHQDQRPEQDRARDSAG